MTAFDNEPTDQPTEPDGGGEFARSVYRGPATGRLTTTLADVDPDRREEILAHVRAARREAGDARVEYKHFKSETEARLAELRVGASETQAQAQHAATVIEEQMATVLKVTERSVKAEIVAAAKVAGWHDPTDAHLFIGQHPFDYADPETGDVDVEAIAAALTDATAARPYLAAPMAEAEPPVRVGPQPDKSQGSGANYPHQIDPATAFFDSLRRGGLML